MIHTPIGKQLFLSSGTTVCDVMIVSCLCVQFTAVHIVSIKHLTNHVFKLYIVLGEMSLQYHFNKRGKSILTEYVKFLKYITKMRF